MALQWVIDCGRGSSQGPRVELEILFVFCLLSFSSVLHPES